MKLYQSDSIQKLYESIYYTYLHPCGSSFILLALALPFEVFLSEALVVFRMELPGLGVNARVVKK